MELWIPITIAAAFLQNARSALQKHLTGRLGTTGATFVRFGFGFPLALVYLGFLHWGLGLAWPTPGPAFWGFVTVGALGQLGATAALLRSFTHRNFAVGTAYSKTEPVQAALFGIVILGEAISLAAMAAIIIGIAGVIMISIARSAWTAGNLGVALVSPAALLGLGAGGLFAVSSVAYRAASLSIEGPGLLMQAGFALAVATVLQTVVMLGFMGWRNPAQIAAVGRAWRPAALVGLVGVSGSALWFVAMTLQNVAFVRALGQIELVFTFAASILVFKERQSRMEATGVGVIVIGITLLLLLG